MTFMHTVFKSLDDHLCMYLKKMKLAEETRIQIVSDCKQHWIQKRQVSQNNKYKIFGIDFLDISWWIDNFHQLVFYLSNSGLTMIPALPGLNGVTTSWVRDPF